MILFIPLLTGTGVNPAANGGGLPWLWIGIGAAALVLAVILIILFRAGADIGRNICLVVTGGDRSGERIKIESAYTTLGSEGDNDIVLGDDKVSQHHARLTFGKGKLKVADANSLYGTFVNGERVETAVCANGDILRLGPNFECRVEMESG